MGYGWGYLFKNIKKNGPQGPVLSKAQALLTVLQSRNALFNGRVR
ncbi:MAG: hypothetical protein RJB45_203 [Pseudomonadota bacterium]|jgi:hypothetical protein